MEGHRNSCSDAVMQHQGTAPSGVIGVGFPSHGYTLNHRTFHQFNIETHGDLGTPSLGTPLDNVGSTLDQLPWCWMNKNDSSSARCSADAFGPLASLRGVAEDPKTGLQLEFC